MPVLTIAAIVLLLELSAVFSISAFVISRSAKDVTNVFTELRIAVSNLAETAKGIAEAVRDMGGK